MFTDSTYPKIFGDEAMDAYMSSQDAFTSIFQDKEKYNVIFCDIKMPGMDGTCGL